MNTTDYLTPEWLAKLIMQAHSTHLAAKVVYGDEHHITLNLRQASKNLRAALAVLFEMIDNEAER